MEVLAGLVLIGALTGLIIVGLRYRAEQREGARVRAIFSRYLAPPIVEELLRRKDPHLYTGRSLHATILVCRIWNFAGFAEELSAEETLRYLNEFFALAGTSIQKYRGMIDKFLADGIIGVFGVPLEDPEGEEHALRAALDIVRLVDAMDRRWQAQGRRSFQVGIGINSGDVIAGDAGFHERREFTVVGPETLFAARLQDLTLDLNASVVAATTTCTPVQQLFSLLPLTGHPLPGLKRLSDAFIVLGLIADASPLAMPGAGTFKETQVDAAVRVVSTPGARTTPPPPEIVPLGRIDLDDPLASLRRRARIAADTTFGPPGPPPRFSSYEDREGPPVELPP